MKAYNTCCSQAVTHPGTEQARRCLTAVIGREPVLSAWYGRRHRLCSGHPFYNNRSAGMVYLWQVCQQHLSYGQFPTLTFYIHGVIADRHFHDNCIAIIILNQTGLHMERCPHFRGYYVQISMEFGPEGVLLLNRGVVISRVLIKKVPVEPLMQNEEHLQKYKGHRHTQPLYIQWLVPTCPLVPL